MGNEMFLHNMRALWQHDPELALRIDAVPDDERVPLEPTKSRAWTARMHAPDGTATYLHSRYDPVREAERFSGAVPIEDKFCFVVSGLGLGYHIRALFDRLKGDTCIICTEPSIPLIATALCCVDLTDVIHSQRFLIFTDADKARWHRRIAPFNTLMMLGAQFVRHAPSLRVAGSAHNEINQMITEYVSYQRMTLLTLVRNSQITCKNIAMNLVSYVTTPPIDILRDRFKGNPGVVISAGPSLSRNIDQLAQLKGRAVLCAVQTTVKPLMRRGIVPDFVTSLDFHEMSQKFFDGVEGLEHTHLVAEPKATWHVVDNYPGPVSLLDNGWARLVIGDELGARAGLTPGATVAHLAFYLAVYLGCDPIIFVGQDLAFTGHVFYVPGVDIHQAWQSEINRFNTMEMKEWDRIVRNRPILRKVKSVDGGELYTDDLLFTYLEQFVKDIAAAPARVIDATEGGAYIHGAEPMALADVVERYCRNTIEPSRFGYREATKWRDGTALPAAREALEKRVAELDTVVDTCDELLSLLKKLEGLTDDPAAFNRTLIRVDELRSRVHHESRAYAIVNAATQLAELQRFSADRRIGVADTDEVERAKRQLARDRDFVSAVRSGARDVKPMLSAALERVNRWTEPA